MLLSQRCVKYLAPRLHLCVIFIIQLHKGALSDRWVHENILLTCEPTGLTPYCTFSNAGERVRASEAHMNLKQNIFWSVICFHLCHVSAAAGIMSDVKSNRIPHGSVETVTLCSENLTLIQITEHKQMLLWCFH